MGNQMSEEDANGYLQAYLNNARGGESGSEDENDPDYEIIEEEEVEEEEEEVVESGEEDSPPPVNSNADTSAIQSQILYHSGHKPNVPDKNVYTQISEREVSSKSWNHRNRVHISQRYLPYEGSGRMLKSFRYRGFCGQYSKDGSTFMTASEGRSIKFYESKKWKQFKEITAGLEIRDTDYSPDSRWLVYSGWSPSIYLCNVVGEHEVHDSLSVMDGDGSGPWGYYCLFSTKFSPDSNEVLCGSNDNSLYIYDLNRRELALRVEGHANDVNTVCYLGNDHNTFLTGSDDCLVKLWDRRILGKGREAVGAFAGHVAGITHVSSKLDGYYFVSNGKDQCAKLWDIRHATSPSSIGSNKFARGGYDYRLGAMSNIRRNHPNDCSVSTYTGHVVGKTLIRCYFSPMETTGQRYLVSGSADGQVYIYDVVTSKLLRRLRGHTSLVRDISWHPNELKIISTSWDTTLGVWDRADPERKEFFPENFVTRHHSGWW